MIWSVGAQDWSRSMFRWASGGIWRLPEAWRWPRRGCDVSGAMRPEEYVAFDAMGLAALVHRGDITPQELTEAAIERIEALNARLNAVVERNYDAARVAAPAIDLAAPLAGVPFLAKDMNIEVA